MEEALGKHYIIEFHHCDVDQISNVPEVEEVLLNAVDKAGATYVSHDTHQFDPVGVSAVVMIAESHFTIHTWPEKEYAAMDIFTCGVMEAQNAIDYIKEKFQADHCKVTLLERGT